jgi:long-chain acyl-CoA synthetase
MMKRTVLRMLKEAAAKYSNIPYALKKFDSGYVGTTFLQVREQARMFAAWLLANNFKKGDRAAIIAEGSPEWLISELGVLSAGMTSVPLSIKLLSDEIPFRIEHSESKIICTTHNQLEKIANALMIAHIVEMRIVYFDDDIEWGQSVLSKSKISEDCIISLKEVLSIGASLLKQNNEYVQKLDLIEETAEENDVVTISYTSGTTGNPKGIMLSHLNYWSNCHDAIDLFDNPMYFRTLLILPVDHSFAHTVGLYTAMICGISLYFVDSRGGGIATLRNIPLNLKESDPIFLFTVPSLSGNFMKKIIAAIEEKGGLIERIFKNGIEAGILWNGDGYHTPPFKDRFNAFFPYFMAKLLVFNKIKKALFGNSIRFCVGGGAFLDIKQQQFFAALGVPVYQGYGLTEAAPIISSNTPRIHKFGTSGIIAPSVSCKVMDENGVEVQQGTMGHITITGENVMLGYYRNPEATAEVLRDGRLWTGDLGSMDEDGFLAVIGRAKALLIREDGEKYSPEEIEEAITMSTDVFDQIMVWCDHRKYTMALVTLDEVKVKNLIAKRSIHSAEALLAILVDEFYRFKNDPKAKKVQSTWIPSVFQIVEEPFSEQNGTINSTMKLVRHKVSEVYKEYIEYSYLPEGSSTMNKKNLSLIARRFSLD